VEGWIKLHRKILDNNLWRSEPFTRGQAWVDLILLANHKNSFFYKRGNRVNVDRGQVGRSQVELADRWSWSRGKVKRFLNELENEQQIEQQKTSVTQILTIVNYEKYQENGQQTEQQTGSRRAADGQQTDTYKNVKNVKNGKNEKKLLGKTPSNPEQVKDYFIEIGLNGISEEEAHKFFDYYTSIGWVVGKGKTPMKDWKAAARGWKSRIEPKDLNKADDKPQMPWI
jgi:hypothetical protein